MTRAAIYTFGTSLCGSESARFIELKQHSHGVLTAVCDNGILMLPALTPTIKPDRRIKIRYPVRLAVWYRTVGQPQSLHGVGKTLNMSSSGILFDCQEGADQDILRAGVPIEVSMEWPSLLDANIPLQLVTSGRIVWSAGTICGMAFTKYQFRTMKPRLWTLRKSTDKSAPILSWATKKWPLDSKNNSV